MPRVGALGKRFLAASGTAFFCVVGVRSLTRDDEVFNDARPYERGHPPITGASGSRRQGQPARGRAGIHRPRARKNQAGQHPDQQVLDQAKQDQRQLEVRRKDLENEVEAKKEQILKFSQQQLETKKNVEYQTLGREIDHVREAISEIEEQEMELMEQQDAFKSTLAEANQVAEEAKSGEAKKISDLDEREKNIESELDAMDEERDGIVSKINKKMVYKIAKYDL